MSSFMDQCTCNQNTLNTISGAVPHQHSDDIECLCRDQRDDVTEAPDIGSVIIIQNDPCHALKVFTVFNTFANIKEKTIQNSSYSAHCAISSK